MSRRILQKEPESIPLTHALWATPYYLFEVKVEEVPNILLSDRIEVKVQGVQNYMPVKDFKVGFYVQDICDYKLYMIDQFRNTYPDLLESDLHKQTLVEDPLDWLALVYAHEAHRFTGKSSIWTQFLEGAKGKRPAEFLAYLTLNQRLYSNEKVTPTKLKDLASKLKCDETEFAVISGLETVRKNFMSLQAARRALNLQISNSDIFPFYFFRSEKSIESLMGLSSPDTIRENFLETLWDFILFAELVEMGETDLKLGLYKNKQDGLNCVAFENKTKITYFQQYLVGDMTYYAFKSAENLEAFSYEFPLKFSTVIHMMQETSGLLDPPLKKTQKLDGRMLGIREFWEKWRPWAIASFNKMYPTSSRVQNDSLSEEFLKQFFEKESVGHWYENPAQMKGYSQKLQELRSKFG